MRILITGGAGFIGSHLCDLLLDKGHSIICVDNLITGSLNNLAQHKKNPRFLFIKRDISKPLKIKGKVDFVLHFASPASPVDYAEFPIQTLKVGALGTHNALGLARAHHAKFLLASTSEIYGDPLVTPQKEEYWGNVNPIGPRSCYDEAKRFAEALTMSYHRAHQLDTRIIRIFNTYGPRMRKHDGRVVPNFINQALRGQALTIYGRGAQTRSFCYISDLVDGIYQAMCSDYHLPLNLGNPKEISIQRFALEIQRAAKTSCQIKYLPLPKDDPQQRKPDIRRARKILGWEPQVSLSEGLSLTFEYFNQQG